MRRSKLKTVVTRKLRPEQVSMALSEFAMGHLVRFGALAHGLYDHANPRQQDRVCWKVRLDLEQALENDYYPVASQLSYWWEKIFPEIETIEDLVLNLEERGLV